jgi:hypothetical protein
VIWFSFGLPQKKQKKMTKKEKRNATILLFIYDLSQLGSKRLSTLALRVYPTWVLRVYATWVLRVYPTGFRLPENTTHH